jgi:WD40 repeat protein
VVWELVNTAINPEILLAPNRRSLGLDGVNALAISPDSQYVALAEVRYGFGFDSFSTDMFSTPWARIDVWRLTGRRRVQRFAGHPRGILALVFHPDGQTIVSSADDREAKFWRVRPHSLVCHSFRLMSGLCKRMMTIWRSPSAAQHRMHPTRGIRAIFHRCGILNVGGGRQRPSARR